MSKIKLYISGEKITSDKLRASMSAFYGILDEVGFEITNKRKPITWIVSVESGSMSLVNEPSTNGLPPQTINEVVSSVSDGIDTLEKRGERPPYFNDRALEFASDLASIPSRKNGLNKIEIIVGHKHHILTAHTSANVDELLAIYGRALGSVEGRLSTISERHGLKIHVYDRLTDRAIRCQVDDEMLEEITHAFGKRVYVYGLISYGKDKFPRSIKVEEIKVFPDKDKIPSAMEVCGILGG